MTEKSNLKNGRSEDTERNDENKEIVEDLKAEKNDKLEKNDELSEARRQAEEYLIGWQRAKADYANLLKDLETRKKEMAEMASLRIILEILPIHLSFKTALAHIPEGQKDNDWVVGIGHIKAQMDDFLKNQGVKEIETAGKFDPVRHEAISQENHDDLPDEEIIREVEGGYEWNDKTIKPARVVVNVKN